MNRLHLGVVLSVAIFISGAGVAQSPRPKWPTVRGAYVARSSETIPAFPSSLSGYRSDAGKDYWGRDFVTRGTVRVFQGNNWDMIYPPLPATMNHCSDGVFMIRWRSANPNILIDSALGPYTTENIPNLDNLISANAARASSTFGYMQGTNCDQPMFKFARSLNNDGSTLVDVYYELKFWQAAP